MSEPLPADIAEAVRVAGQRIGPIGDRLIYRARVSSTNDVALALVASGAKDWTTVLAGSQAAGRGRQGRWWFSAPDVGLYFSTIMRGIEVTTLTLMAGVAVTEGVRAATGVAAEIKWPNDVVLSGPPPEGRQSPKVAGILTEASRFRGTVDAVVVGIGVNVSPTLYPPELTTVAGSLAAAVGRPVNRAAVLVEVLAALTRWRHALAAGRVHQTLARWRELAPTSEGTRVAWYEQGQRRLGVTHGIDSDGALLVACEGRVERLVAGDVTWLTPTAHRTRRGETDAAGDRRR